MRPKPIILFERLYLLGIVVGVISNAVAWQGALARLAAARVDALSPRTLLLLAIASLLLDLVLWHLAAHRASRVAKWILAVWIALGMIGLALGLARHAFVGGLVGMLTVITTVLKLAAIAQTFTPEARAWFARRPA